MKRIITFVICLLAYPALGQEIVGNAVALDGDTLRIIKDDGETVVTVRLWAIDAPEMSMWPWGPLARGAVDMLLERSKSKVSCNRKNRDTLIERPDAIEVKRESRVIAKCWAIIADGRVEIGEFLIQRGFAVEYRNFGNGYYWRFEQKARMDKVGVWKR